MNIYVDMSKSVVHTVSPCPNDRNRNRKSKEARCSTCSQRNLCPSCYLSLLTLRSFLGFFLQCMWLQPARRTWRHYKHTHLFHSHSFQLRRCCTPLLLSFLHSLTPRFCLCVRDEDGESCRQLLTESDAYAVHGKNEVRLYAPQSEGYSPSRDVWCCPERLSDVS